MQAKSSSSSPQLPNLPGRDLQRVGIAKQVNMLKNATTTIMMSATRIKSTKGTVDQISLVIIVSSPSIGEATIWWINSASRVFIWTSMERRWVASAGKPQTVGLITRMILARCLAGEQFQSDCGVPNSCQGHAGQLILA